MSKFEKAKLRIKNIPRDYRYAEAKQLLGFMGFTEINKGKTSGSRVKFYRKRDNAVILLHKPHPEDVMKVGAVRNLKQYLEEIGEI